MITLSLVAGFPTAELCKLTVECVRAVPSTSEHAANAIEKITGTIKSDRRVELV